LRESHEPDISLALACTAALADIAGGLIARGEYIVRLGGCNDCHTPGWNDSAGQLPTAQWLTGSPLGNLGPWGTTYPANLRLKVAAWMSRPG
jgi:mono/diheme cytochrome c family protein